MEPSIYRIFISATFKDLQEDRKRIMEHVVNSGYIPLGMELFPSTNSSVAQIIDKQIHDCDYYVLIVWKRYGCVMENGISFTEWEFNLAKEAGKPLIILFKESDDPNYPYADEEPSSTKNLALFKNSLAQRYCPSYYKDSTGLISKFAISMQTQISEQPQYGLVSRGNSDERIMNLLNIIHPNFHHFILEEREDEDRYEATLDRQVDFAHSLLDYWEKILSSKRTFRFSNELHFRQLISSLATSKYPEESDFTDAIDEISINELFNIFKSIGLIDEQYQPTEYGRQIGDQISRFRRVTGIDR